MKEKKDYSEFYELDKHKGSELYEVAEIFDKNYIIRELRIDSEKEQLIASCKTIEIQDKKTIYTRVKISIHGKIKDKGPIYTSLKDGTLWYSKCYNNWIINGDTTKHNYIDPLSAEEKNDVDKWLVKFKELYTTATFVHLYMSDYYFKIEKKWYFVKAYKMGKALNINIKKQFPPKEDQDVRMVELENLRPRYYIPPNERDTSLVKEVGYKSTYYEKIDNGLVSRGYSAGWWYLEIYMPGGDTLKIKRYASYSKPEFNLYKIPKEHGGRDDVLFIIQEPHPIHLEQAGGMYVIRPRNYNKPKKKRVNLNPVQKPVVTEYPGFRTSSYYSREDKDV